MVAGRGVVVCLHTGWFAGFWNDAPVLWAPATLGSGMGHSTRFPCVAEGTSEVLK